MLTRRQLMATACVAATTSALAASASSTMGSDAVTENELDSYLSQIAKRKKRPNILLMVLDDAGWGDLGCYGNRIAHTENIDRLADQGVRFQAFHTGSSVCGPSRVCLFTGRHPAKVGINANPNERNDQEHLNTVDFLPAGTQNLLSVFKTAGYATGFFGKAHFGGTHEAPSMLTHGADRFFGWSCTPSDLSEYSAWSLFQGRENWPAPMQSVDKNGIADRFRYQDEKATAEALKFIQAANQPWFAQLNFHTPHTPLDPRPEDRDAIRDGKPFWSRPDEKLWSPDQFYYGALHSVDKRCIGPVLKWLDDTGQRDDTIVVLTSDNGAMTPYNPSEAIWSSGYNGGYSGWKAQLDIGSVRAPCIFSWPGVLAESAVTTQIGYFADMLPTLAFLAGIEVPDRSILDGENIAHALVSEVTRDRTAPIFYYYPNIVSPQLIERTPTLSMLTPDGKWYFQCDASQGQNPIFRPALFELTDDPGQADNLYDPAATGPTGEMSRELPKTLLTWAHKYLPKGWESNRTNDRHNSVRLRQTGRPSFPVKEK